MIVTTTRHGRTRRDVRQLAAHLDRGEEARVVAIGGVMLSNADDVLRYMEALRDGSRATVAMHHVTLSPAADLTDEQRDGMVAAVLGAMDAEDHAHVLWEHRKERAEQGGSARHWHLVVGHVGPDGRALEDGHSYGRLEAVARVLEVDWGHAITASRRAAVVAAALDVTRPDVAAAVRAAQPPELPRSAASSATRAIAARNGIDLPAAHAAVRAAWAVSDNSRAFQVALADSGLTIAPGIRAGVWVVRAGDVDAGALDRVVRTSRARIADRMRQDIAVDRIRDQLDAHRRSAEDRLRQADVVPPESEELVAARAAVTTAKQDCENAFYSNIERERDALVVLRKPPAGIWDRLSRRAEERDLAVAVLKEIQVARGSAHEIRTRAETELARIERAVAPRLALNRDRRLMQAARAWEELRVLNAAEACLMEVPGLRQQGFGVVLREARRRLDRNLDPRPSDDGGLAPESTCAPLAMFR